jgi:hypothetical protein
VQWIESLACGTRAPRGFPPNSLAGIDIQAQIRNRGWPVNIPHFPRPAGSFKTARGKADVGTAPSPPATDGRLGCLRLDLAVVGAVAI